MSHSVRTLLVTKSWYQSPATRFLVQRSWCQDFGAKFPSPRTLYHFLGIGSWYRFRIKFANLQGNSLLLGVACYINKKRVKVFMPCCSLFDIRVRTTMLATRSSYQGLGITILVARSWHQDLDAKILVTRSWHQGFGTKIFVPRYWCQDPVPRSWHIDFGTNI